MRLLLSFVVLIASCSGERPQFPTFTDEQDASEGTNEGSNLTGDAGSEEGATNDDAGTTGHQSGSQGTTNSGGDTSGELEGASSGDVLTDGGEFPPDAAPMDSHPTADEEDSSCGQIDGATDCADTGVDVCVEDNGGCDTLSTCKNTPVGAECGACPSGYAGDGSRGCVPTLQRLDVSHGALEPQLDADVYVYDVEVPVYIEHVTLTPTVPVDATATVRGATVASGASWTSPSLDLGLNTFSVTVEQEGQASATYSLRITRGAAATAYVKASNTGSGDNFGGSVALSADGRTLAVVATGEDSDATGVGGDEDNEDALSSGAVYVFVRTDDGWAQQAYLKASNTDEADGFGSSVALSSAGNTLAVGAVNEASNATGTSGAGQDNNDASSAGAVYVFVRSGSGWAQQAYLKASNTNAGDNFGTSVALSGDGSTLAVGAMYEGSDATGASGADQDNNDAGSAGAVYVFGRSGSGWAQQAYLKASNTDAADTFGTSVTLSGDGDTLAVGASLEDSSVAGTSGAGQSDNDASIAGAVYVFVRGGSGWSQQAYLKASNTDAGDALGSSVALSSDGNTLAVAAVDEDSNATGTSGAGQDNNDASNAGAVYVFVRGGDAWSQQAYLKASNTDAADKFGTSVTLSGEGNILAVGASLEYSGATGTSGAGQSDNDASAAGAAYVFVRSGNGWSQQAYLKASNTGAGDFFGSAVALSSDGSTLAVGAMFEDSDATGTSGAGQDNNDASNAGAVYVYR